MAHSPHVTPHHHVPRLHVLTSSRPDAAGLDAVLAAGAPLVQVRWKGTSDRDVLTHAGEVATRARRHGATVVVNDRVDLALASGADGVHLGADDLPVAEARRLADAWAADGRPRPLVGGTARDAETARALVDAGADYLGVGPCWTSTSKTGLPPPGGPTRIAAVATAVDVPVIAIGGVTAGRVPALLEAGAHGIAVIGAVWSAPDPGAAVRDLLAALEGAR